WPDGCAGSRGSRAAPGGVGEMGFAGSYLYSSTRSLPEASSTSVAACTVQLTTITGGGLAASTDAWAAAAKQAASNVVASSRRTSSAPSAPESTPGRVDRHSIR